MDRYWYCFDMGWGMFVFFHRMKIKLNWCGVWSRDTPILMLLTSRKAKVRLIETYYQQTSWIHPVFCLNFFNLPFPQSLRPPPSTTADFAGAGSDIWGSSSTCLLRGRYTQKMWPTLRFSLLFVSGVLGYSTALKDQCFDGSGPCCQLWHHLVWSHIQGTSKCSNRKKS